ncbi:expressed protein [Phakopsora pachyrhizi]|uniref:Expressed protein n=1 Tax=Phakopsora pachyrhizi TaxID=170000 RepID=A0AAV0BDQ5_PHAPC|nr:expressed protein [Phakopsora pachyrhizi]
MILLRPKYHHEEYTFAYPLSTILSLKNCFNQKSNYYLLKIQREMQKKKEKRYEICLISLMIPKAYIKTNLLSKKKKPFITFLNFQNLIKTTPIVHLLLLHRVKDEINFYVLQNKIPFKVCFSLLLFLSFFLKKFKI